MTRQCIWWMITIDIIVLLGDVPGFATSEHLSSKFWHRLYAGCPSLCNPPICSGLGKSTDSPMINNRNLVALWFEPMTIRSVAQHTHLWVSPAPYIYQIILCKPNQMMKSDQKDCEQTTSQTAFVFIIRPNVTFLSTGLLFCIFCSFAVKSLLWSLKKSVEPDPMGILLTQGHFL